MVQSFMAQGQLQDTDGGSMSQTTLQFLDSVGIRQVLLWPGIVAVMVFSPVILGGSVLLGDLFSLGGITVWIIVAHS